jgi:hypothetical protein
MLADPASVARKWGGANAQGLSHLGPLRAACIGGTYPRESGGIEMNRPYDDGGLAAAVQELEDERGYPVELFPLGKMAGPFDDLYA